MKNFKGTKGEWVISKKESARVQINDSMINVFGLRITDEEMIANANLIAAAPELLEALQECQKFIVDARDLEAANQYFKNMNLINKALGQ